MDALFKIPPPPIVWVLTTRFSAELPEALYQDCLSGLPAVESKRISRLRRWQDRHAGILGKWLLQSGLCRMGLATIETRRWSRTAYGKPFLEMGPAFNLSHSGDRVVCAISTQGPVGIDIEEKRPIDPLELSSFFTETEWRRIAAATDRISLFFELWTQKESVMKADGRGMRLDPKRIVIEMNQARVIGANSYRLHMLNVAPDYMCCLATVEETPEVRIIDNDI